MRKTSDFLPNLLDSDIKIALCASEFREGAQILCTIYNLKYMLHSSWCFVPFLRRIVETVQTSIELSSAQCR